MKKYVYIILLAGLVNGCIFLTSCKKDDDEKIPPSISLNNTADFTTDGAIVMVGRSIKLGIQARANDGNLTNLTINKHLPNGDIIPVMDTGMNTSALNINKVFYQSIEDTAVWIISVQDRNRMSAQASLTIYKDPNSSWGGIIHHKSITMGYQQNTLYGHFLDPFSGNVYFEDSATIMQQNMEMLVYYFIDNNLPSPVFSSAGEIDNYSTEAKDFYPSIESWQTRNYTLWDISVDNEPISTELFDEAQNDSLLIVSYDEIWGKKKFKWAANGNIIPFQTHTGKRGLIKVLNAQHSPDGILEFEMKIQL